eukprot:g6607.t1
MMSGQIVPKRFGLKYSPKPAIALEYQKPDSDLAILEVFIEQLSPGTYDVEGVVDALQKNHPCHLGPNLVSTDQLERLVARLLFEGRAHLPEEYPTPTRMIVEGPQEQPSSFPSSSSSLSHERSTKPSLLPKGEELSGSLSNGPTPAPTPEVQRATRDPSDGSSTASEPRSPRDNGSEDAGAHHEKWGSAVNTSSAAVHQASSSSGNDEEGLRLPTAALENTAAAAAAATLLREQDVRGWDDDEEDNSRREEEEEGDAREREEERSEQVQGSARDSTREYSREEGDAPPPSLAAISSEANVKREQHEILEEQEDKGSHNDDQFADDEAERYGQHRETEGKTERPATSPKSFSAAAAAAATTVNAFHEEPDRGKSSGESRHENENHDEERPGWREEGEDERDEEEIPEIEEEEDDHIPEDVESEEFYETGSSHAGEKDDEGQADDGDKEPRRTGDDSSKEAENTDSEAEPLMPSRDAVTVVEKETEASIGEGDHKENDRACPTVISGEEGDLETPTPPPVASPLQITPTVASPTAPSDTTPPSQGSSQEGHNSPPSLSSHSSPSGGLAPALSSPEAGTGFAASSLAGLPLPPMGGGRQRLGLLGSLPPVGGRGLPSLGLPLGKKTVDTNEGGEKSGGADSEDDAKGATGMTSGSPSPLGSPRWSPTPPRVTGKDSATAPEVAQPSHAARGGQEKEVDDVTAGKDAEGDGEVLGELARLPATRGGQAKDAYKEEEAALRTRLGFGQDEDDGDEEEHGDAEGDGDAEGVLLGDGGNNVPSTPDSPKQHQGQEEEDAGRIPPPGPRGEEDEGVPSGGGAGGDYFGGDSEGDASSIGEDISFEQESVDGEGGGGGSGSDDYFS